MNAARFRASKPLLDAFASHVEDDGELAAYCVTIVDEAYTVAKSARFSEPNDLDPKALLSDEGAACFLLVQQPSRKQWCMVSFIPESCRVRDRMLYASGRDSLKRELGAGQFYPRDIHCTEVSELAAAVFVDEATQARKKEYQGRNSLDFAKNTRAVGEALVNAASLGPKLSSTTLSDTERQAIEDERAMAAESAQRSGPLAGRGISGAALGFPASDEARAALGEFTPTSLSSGGPPDGLLLAVKAEQVQIAGRFAPTGAASLRSALTQYVPNEPAFAVLRHASPDGALATVLVSVCPDETPVRTRMIHSSAKPAVKALLDSIGVEVAKSVETQDVSDVTDEWITERLQPHGERADEAGTPESGTSAPARRPAPKGGRRLLPKADSSFDD
mmetsp:Transcript_4207/g.10840  ORF Transcript_4207/g.10840 Transcript_4207/m.10840 type:complete len:390 (+) Transcript_4207:45-1214(+)